MNKKIEQTCQNTSCKKVFTIPLKTLNLQNPTEPFYACPFCLTKIAETPLELAKQPEKTQVSVTVAKEKFVSKEKPSGCRYHLGYLSERVQKEQIPDDCLVCKDIVECMLSKMKA